MCSQTFCGSLGSGEAGVMAVFYVVHSTCNVQLTKHIKCLSMSIRALCYLTYYTTPFFMLLIAFRHVWDHYIRSKLLFTVTCIWCFMVYCLCGACLFHVLIWDAHERVHTWHLKIMNWRWLWTCTLGSCINTRPKQTNYFSLMKYVIFLFLFVYILIRQTNLPDKRWKDSIKEYML